MFLEKLFFDITKNTTLVFGTPLTKTLNMKTFDSKFWWIFIPFLLLIILILFFPFWFTTRSFFEIDFSNSGPIGDTIGGIMGPFIAIAAAILTFFAFWVQFKANEQQKQDLKIERFENKFYNMLEINRQNVSEFAIGKSLIGRKVFISMFDELKFLYLTVDKFFKSANQRAIILTWDKTGAIDPKDTYNIAYLIFFYGIGQNSTKLVLSPLDSKYEGLLLNLEEYLKVHQKGWKESKELNFEQEEKDETRIFKLKTTYKPFNGHMSRLGHYIRHLYLLINYIDEQPEEIVNYNLKYEYAATVRAQLSTHEQIFIYYNSLSILGENWLKKGLLEKYCIIKNIPIPLADFYKKPQEILPKINKQGKEVFEWNRLSNKES